MLVISDTHLAVTRSGGTTPQSQQALRDYLRESLANLLAKYEGEHVVVNGDLFDAFQVDTAELIKTYEILAKHKGGLTLIMGNHDASAKADRVSSFHLLCHFLKEVMPGSFRMIDHNDGFTEVFNNVYAVSHCMNQALFDLEIEKASAFDGKGRYLLLHANFKNGHAEHSDHSLNVNDEQIAALMRAGWVVVFGHEHVGGEFRSGRVIIVGNNFPSSVSDCIDDPIKNALIIDANGHRYVETWNAETKYIEVDWRDLSNLDGYDFIRVTGEATAIEAAEVIKAISSLRQRSDVYVIGNAVKVDGQNMITDMADQSIEDVKAFDVVAAIMSELTPEEAECVKGLLC